MRLAKHTFVGEKSDYYDITATASVTSPTLEQRAAMLRAMLADRFQLVTHRERREVPSFNLLPARNDGKFGAGLVKTDTDCDALLAERRKEAEARVGPPPPPQRFDPNAPPPCSFVGMPNGLKGELTLGNLASMLRQRFRRCTTCQSSGRPAIGRSTLPGRRVEPMRACTIAKPMPHMLVPMMLNPTMPGMSQST